MCCANCGASALGGEVASLCTSCGAAGIAGASFSLPAVIAVVALSVAGLFAIGVVRKTFGSSGLLPRPRLA